jgi:FAD/FMN-containing dehydrogenase
MQDGVVPQDSKQTSQIWKLREEIANANISLGYTLKYDVSLSSDHFYKLVEETRQKIRMSDKLSNPEKDSITTFGYGHIGDGNLHLNITIPGYKDESLQNRLNDFIDPFVMEYVRDAKGSISAEHGLGL